MKLEKCASKNRKMCEEPCYSCGKCWSTKPVCVKCTNPYTRKSKCRYTDEQIENRRKQYCKTYDKAIYIVIAVSTILSILNIISGIHFIVHAITNRSLGFGAILIWYFKTYWWLLLIDLFIAFKFKK
ncbi:MAG: hypothetical protein NC548_15595 [Lachnospiraceae bacterium]|nr:hypothetical protein [Lachnospiraceae bacterium]